MESRLNKIICGDCLEVMRGMPDNSIHCCVTSPPYWGLRDYGVNPLVWGGDPDCTHEWGIEIQHNKGTGGHNPKQDSNKGSWRESGTISGQFCIHCGAWLGCFGLEPTPELYVEHCVAIFRDVKRVLRDDGTLWLNLGDSYAGYHGNSKVPSDEAPSNKNGYIENMRETTVGKSGLKPKDLVGIPWRVAFALQADGWYLRSDIIWHKPNPMPESVKDRPTKAHEYIFLMSKSQKYYYDYEAIKEPCESGPSDIKKMKEGLTRIGGKHKNLIDELSKASSKTNIGQKRSVGDPSGRNKRSVWTIATQPFSEAHFATFPPKLIEPCILAGCPDGGIVLDPFMGAGTTALVALKHKRYFVGIELKQEYKDMSDSRIASNTI